MFFSLPRQLSTAMLSPAPLLLAISAYSQKLPSSGVSQLATVPNCALNCVGNFIATDYPYGACSCCSISFCSIEVALNSSVYGICDSIPGALSRTHATITATVVSVLSPTSILTTETESPSPSPTTPGDPTPPRTGHSSTTLTTFQSPVAGTIRNSSSTASSQQASQSATSGAAAGKESSLNAGAVIGVSVSSGIAGFFILGVVVFFCCRKMKRRYQQPKDKNFFEIGGVMSEPPDFSLPPRRPTPGLNSPSRAGHGNTETSRLMSPYEPSPRNPAVIVTGPDDDCNYGSTRIHHPDKIGFAISSSSDLEPSESQSSPRTVSDLLPEKPVYGLCPEPLRWGQQKYARPTSGETLFEEDAARPRSFLGGTKQHKKYPNSPTPYDQNSQYKRPPMAGLPDNPRVMFLGYRAQNDIVNPSGPGRREKTAYASAGDGLQARHQTDGYGNPSDQTPGPYNMQHNSYIGDYWRGPDVRKARDLPELPSSPNAGRHSDHDADVKDTLLDSPSDEFETINISESSGSHLTSRHSRNFRPLTPVREIRTPKNEGQKRDYFDENAHVKYPRMPFSRAISPVQEIVSRPKIVRRDDIKRVEIRRGKPQPKELNVPYSLNDYGHGYSHGFSSETKPYRLSGDWSSTKIQNHMAKEKRLSSERNLNPSRRGSDLILRVD
ncbi:hypothetical protein BDV28DRAFT_129436 [Aspergillus coremiiformis]|uniref:Extracellular membrane protein CFEM domain-containing protein n=1 Tax=Aspergillus coremiiformis TaxID=138285 RepID=A0A5N6ZGB8_9EURO|nr:hypothetical protein BDV28DRAFT_129436 [Aspergillus coremiiformis]